MHPKWRSLPLPTLVWPPEAFLAIWSPSIMPQSCGLGLNKVGSHWKMCQVIRSLPRSCMAIRSHKSHAWAMIRNCRPHYLHYGPCWLSWIAKTYGSPNTMWRGNTYLHAYARAHLGYAPTRAYTCLGPMRVWVVGPCIGHGIYRPCIPAGQACYGPRRAWFLPTLCLGMFWTFFIPNWGIYLGLTLRALEESRPHFLEQMPAAHGWVNKKIKPGYSISSPSCAMLCLTWDLFGKASYSNKNFIV